MILLLHSEANTSVDLSENVNDHTEQKEKKNVFVLWFQSIKNKCLKQEQSTVSAAHEAEPSSTSDCISQPFSYSFVIA